MLNGFLVRAKLTGVNISAMPQKCPLNHNPERISGYAWDVPRAKTKDEPCVHAKEKIDGTPRGCLFERLIEPLVSRVGRAPNLVLEGLMNVILRIGLDNEVTSLAGREESKSRVDNDWPRTEFILEKEQKCKL